MRGNGTKTSVMEAIFVVYGVFLYCFGGLPAYGQTGEEDLSGYATKGTVDVYLCGRKRCDCTAFMRVALYFDPQ